MTNPPQILCTQMVAPRASLQKKRVLVTGGLGFIGHHMIEGILKHTDWDIVCLDGYTYAAFPLRLEDTNVWSSDGKRVRIIYHDLREPLQDSLSKKIGKIDYVLHLAAESHVANSLLNPLLFINSNIIGTYNLLEYLKKQTEGGNNIEKIIYFSTDEVCGPSSGHKPHPEDIQHLPSNPYSATKAAGEDLAYSYKQSYNLPIIITRTTNNFGERQHPEKFLPLIFSKIINNEVVPLHVSLDARGNIVEFSSRLWIHPRNVFWIIKSIFDHGQVGETYHIPGAKKTVLEIAQIVAKLLNKPLNWKPVDFHNYYSGHDMHYDLTDTKLSKSDWAITYTFERSFTNAVKWMFDRPEWLDTSRYINATP